MFQQEDPMDDELANALQKMAVLLLNQKRGGRGRWVPLRHHSMLRGLFQPPKNPVGKPPIVSGSSQRNTAKMKMTMRSEADDELEKTATEWFNGQGWMERTKESINKPTNQQSES